MALLSFPMKADIPMERVLELMTRNKLKKFVRMAGSEEAAINVLISVTLPDTIFNLNKDLIWRKAKRGSIGEMDLYASRKLQALSWVMKIYLDRYDDMMLNADCVFLDDLGNAIWDYQDLDGEKKAYYYKTILPSPANHKNYFDRLGYIKSNSDEFNQLVATFHKWYQEMKIQGLDRMRENAVSPIPVSRYRMERH